MSELVSIMPKITRKKNKVLIVANSKGLAVRHGSSSSLVVAQLMGIWIGIARTLDDQMMTVRQRSCDRVMNWRGF